jgi:hypothetical protein
VRFGDSPKVLREIVPTLSGSALFWLDAHFYDVPDAAGRDDHQCPVLDEIAAIDSLSPHKNFLMIDDARMFMSVPPPPYRGWPTIADVTSTLSLARPNDRLLILDDIVLRCPAGTAFSIKHPRLNIWQHLIPTYRNGRAPR